MVVGYGNRRDIANDFSEVSAELKPISVMPVVVINLVAGKKQKVRVELFNIFNDICFRYIAAVAGINRIARECRHDNCLLIDRVFADIARIICVLALS